MPSCVVPLSESNQEGSDSDIRQQSELFGSLETCSSPARNRPCQLKHHQKYNLLLSIKPRSKNKAIGLRNCYPIDNNITKVFIFFIEAVRLQSGLLNWEKNCACPVATDVQNTKRHTGVKTHHNPFFHWSGVILEGIIFIFIAVWPLYF